MPPHRERGTREEIDEIKRQYKTMDIDYTEAYNALEFYGLSVREIFDEIGLGDED